MFAEGLQGALGVLGMLVGVGKLFLCISYPQAEAVVGLREEDIHGYAPLTAERLDKGCIKVAEYLIARAQVFRECVGQNPVAFYAVDAEALVAEAEPVAVVERYAVL